MSEPGTARLHRRVGSHPHRRRRPTPGRRRHPRRPAPDRCPAVRRVSAAARLSPPRRPAPGRRRRACSAPRTSPARCRCGRWASATCTTRRSGSSASTRRPPSAPPCWWPRSRWRSRCWSPRCSPGPSTSRSTRAGDADDEPSSPAWSGRSARSGSAALLLQRSGLILVTGMIAHVTAAAAVGRRLTLGEAWAATHGKRWRLIGLALLLGLLVAAAHRRLRRCSGCWSSSPRATACAARALGPGQRPGVRRLDGLVLGARLLPAGARADARGRRGPRRDRPRLPAHPQAVLADLRHRAADPAWSRSRRHLLAFPISLVGQVVARRGRRRSTRCWSWWSPRRWPRSISAAFVAPFTSAVTSLQYLDQRMRKEAYDVELMPQAGVTACRDLALVALSDPPLDPSGPRGALPAAPRAAAPGVPRAEPGPARSSPGSSARSTAASTRASQAPPLSTLAAMLVFVALAAGAGLAAVAAPVAPPATDGGRGPC